MSGAPAVTPAGITLQDEEFAQLVASGSTQSDAYRLTHNVGINTLPKTVWQSASVLAAKPKVAARIRQLVSDAQAASATNAAWDKTRLVLAAEHHRQTALSGGWKGVGSANSALEIIGKATGLLVSQPQVVVVGSAAALDGLTTEELRQLASQRETLIAQRERLLKLLEATGVAAQQPPVAEASYTLLAESAAGGLPGSHEDLRPADEKAAFDPGSHAPQSLQGAGTRPGATMPKAARTRRKPVSISLVAQPGVRS